MPNTTERCEPGAFLADELRAAQAQLRQPGGRPPIPAPLVRRLAHYEATARAEEPHGAFSGRGRRSKGPRDHYVVGTSKFGTPSEGLGSAAGHAATIGDVELEQRILEKLAPAALGIEERPGRGRPGKKQGQTGDTAPRAQVEKTPRETAAYCIGKHLGM